MRPIQQSRKILNDLLSQSEDIKASMADGVLTIVYPRSTQETEPKKVTIA
jgi:HSP20 family molecular chaperone IbpA